MIRRALLAFLLLSAGPFEPTSSLHSQKQLLDRIVAVVGDEVILEGELMENLYIMAQQLGVSLEDSTSLLELKGQILESLITEKVILQRAREKGISVSADEVEAAIEKDIATIRSRFDSEEDFLATLRDEGLTLTSYREGLKEEREKQLIQEKFMQELKLPPKHVSDEEIREYFEENRENFGVRPATVKLARILVKPAPGDSVVKEKEAIADEVLTRLVEGDRFEDLAREYSDDASTKNKGGDIGFLERGDMLPEVERVAFLLNPGETSGAIKTDLGYFIVKLEEIRLGKIHLKHILISLSPTEQDEEKARQLAHSLCGRLREGEDFAELARMYSADSDTKGEGGVLGEFTSENIPDRYVGPIESLDVGEVSDPIESTEGWDIIKVLEKNPPRPFELEDVKENIRKALEQEKAFAEFIEKMKEKTYIEVKL
ncbi:MAG: peptidylprolyl isomerase [Candidatus Glassbacteria bacterium]